MLKGHFYDASRHKVGTRALWDPPLLQRGLSSARIHWQREAILHLVALVLRSLARHVVRIEVIDFAVQLRPDSLVDGRVAHFRCISRGHRRFTCTILSGK